MENKQLKVGIVSLGCDKNRVDSEVMLTYLRNAGYVFTSDPEKADIIIINTCGFIANARKESMDTIVEMINFKKKGSCKKLVVTGCMPQLWIKEMREELPEVDIFLGIDQYPHIAEHIAKSFDKSTKLIQAGSQDVVPYVQHRIVTTPTHYAYLKISDGCDNYCTFCTIPFIRGSYRSRNMESILNDAQDLVDDGARELIIIAQDITRYGIDSYGKPMLITLIRELSKIEKLEWIRLLYCYPEVITNELIEEMQNNPKLCKYIDIPLQHVSNNILKRMNRHTTKQDIIKLILSIQSQPKFIAVRTTFMVGFPGETEADFKELYNFVKEYKLTHVGFFSYSKEENTAAGKMPDQIPEKIKQKRLVSLVRLQKEIVKQNNKKFIGKTFDVCIEGFDYQKGLFFGRTEYQSPEIDTLVFVKSNVDLQEGKKYPCKITKAVGYDMIAKLV